MRKISINSNDAHSIMSANSLKLILKKLKSFLQILVKEYEIDEAEAVQIINCMPETVDELRVFLAGGRKIIETAKLHAIVELLNENRTLK